MSQWSSKKIVTLVTSTFVTMVRLSEDEEAPRALAFTG